MLPKNKNWSMLIIWLIVALLGTTITIVGGLKLNDEWTKNDAKRQVHIIPDFMLIDFEVEAEFNKELSDKILTECKSKINVPNGSVEDLKEIPLSVFFTENLYKEDKIAKKNYKLDKEIYENIKSFDIIGMLNSSDKNTVINIRKNSNKIILSILNKDLKDSYIEVRNYNTKTNRFKLLFNNIQINVEFLRQSKFITDLDNGKIKLNIVTKPSIEITEIKNIILKTNSTKYLTVTDIIKDELGSFNAKLKLLLR
jgi:hypothetical protein